MSEQITPQDFTHEAFFGDAATKWREALSALHAFAVAIEATAGTDVIRCFDESTKAFTDAQFRLRTSGKGGLPNNIGKLRDRARP